MRPRPTDSTNICAYAIVRSQPNRSLFMRASAVDNLRSSRQRDSGTAVLALRPAPTSIHRSSSARTAISITRHFNDPAHRGSATMSVPSSNGEVSAGRRWPPSTRQAGRAKCSFAAQKQWRWSGLRRAVPCRRALGQLIHLTGQPKSRRLAVVPVRGQAFHNALSKHTLPASYHRRQSHHCLHTPNQYTRRSLIRAQSFSPSRPTSTSQLDNGDACRHELVHRGDWPAFACSTSDWKRFRSLLDRQHPITHSPRPRQLIATYCALLAAAPSLFPGCQTHQSSQPRC